MSSLALTNVKLFAAGHDLSGQMNAVALQYGADMLDATTFGATSRINAAGLKSIVASHQGLWDATATTSVDPVLFNRIGTADVPVVISPDGGEVGEVAYLFRAIHAEYSPGGSVGELLSYSVSLEGTGGQPPVRGVMLHNGSATGDVTGTAVQAGAVGASSFLYAALHVMSGTGDFTVKVQSDNASNFPTPTDRITFTQVGTATAVASEWATRVAGAITDDYWRIVATNPNTRNFAVAIGIL